jgi:DNA-binding NtrC family response regulator
MSGSVLVIDDDVSIREVIDIVLQVEGIRVEHAETGEAAIVRLRQDPMPSLVLLDLHLPNSSAEDILLHVGDRVRHAGTRMYLMSGDSQGGGLVKTYGLAGFLLKPIELDTLLALARSATVAEHAPVQ